MPIGTKSDPPVVRPMRAEDAEAVVEMARELAAEVADPEPCLDADELIRNGSGPERRFDCFVAEVKGELAGYALTCRGYEAHAGKRRLWLGDLYVRPDARGSGIGRGLIAAIARHALELHCDAIYWERWRPNRAGRTDASFHRASPTTLRIPRAAQSSLYTGSSDFRYSTLAVILPLMCSKSDAARS